YVYDGDHNLTSETDPLGNTTTYGYDADGNQTLTVEPRGYGTQYGYNAIGKLTSQQSGLTKVGSTWQCVNPSICPQTSNTYDLAGNQTATIDPDGNETAYTYDANNRLTVSQSGLDYDSLNQTYDCLSGDICPTTKYSYDAEGNTTTATNPDNYPNSN